MKKYKLFCTKMKIETINLYVTNMENTLSFYRALGFDIKGDQNSKSYVKIELDSINIAFYTFDIVNSFFIEQKLSISTGNQFNISIRKEKPEDIDEIYKNMLQTGYPPFMGPINADWNQRIIFFKDPDGNLIELCAYL